MLTQLYFIMASSLMYFIYWNNIYDNAYDFVAYSYVYQVVVDQCF